MNAAKGSRYGRTAGRRSPAGLTLAEVVLSMVIMSIIMAALVSTLLVAQRGMSGSSGMAQNASQVREAILLIVMDLSFVESFSERTDRTVAFTVPDRDGDDQSETIRYAWSGVAGEPLTRQYNGGAVVNVVDNVHHFALDYLLKQLGQSG